MSRKTRVSLKGWWRWSVVEGCSIAVTTGKPYLYPWVEVCVPRWVCEDERWWRSYELCCAQQIARCLEAGSREAPAWLADLERDEDAMALWAIDGTSLEVLGPIRRGSDVWDASQVAEGKRKRRELLDMLTVF